MRRAARWIAAIALVVLAAGAVWWTRSRRPAVERTPDAAGGGANVVEDAGAPAPDATRVELDAARDAIDARVSSGPPDLLAVAADWAARLDGCPLAKARSREARGYVRFDVSADSALLDARLVDVASGAELVDDCFRTVFGAGRAPDAGITQLTVWWPLGRGQPDAGAAVGATPIQVPGVDLMVVPYFHPIEGLPARGTAGPWVGLCGPPVGRAMPREVTLATQPNEENDDFVDVSVDGCGPKPRLVPVFRGPGLTAETTTALARVRVNSSSPVHEVNVRLGGARYRLWQIATGRPHGILALRVGATVQVLATDEDPEWDFEVIWAGDLDHDDRLDLILRDDEPDEGRYRLYLSGAQRALPVLLAAERQLPGD